MSQRKRTFRQDPESGSELGRVAAQAGPDDPHDTGTEPSDVDAMGQDKRRQVAGGVYGPTRARIVTRFVIFFAVVALLLVGAKIAVDKLDQPPDKVSTEAPWAQPGAGQREPKPLQ
jgi:hypothetical protein